MACCLLLPLTAHAGTYTWQTTNASGQVTAKSPTFTGGNWFDLNYQPHGPVPYETWADGCGTGDSSGQYKSTGTVTATFTWQPAPGQTAQSDPAPPCIVTQTSAAKFYASGFSANPKISCLDGLAAPLDPEDDYTYGTTYEGRCTGTRYSLGTPSSGVVTVTLTGAKMSLDLRQGGQNPDVTSGIRWSVTVAPVTINPGGAINDSSGNYSILVGQGCTASLTGIPSGCTVSSYKWSVSGVTLQKWIVSSDQTNASLTPGFGVATNPTIHWYWSDKPNSETVTCTATVTPPTGQGVPYPITVTQNVSLIRPQTAVSAPTGRVQINNLNQSVYGSGYSLYAGPQGSNGHGITYQVVVITPKPFDTQSSGALWNLVQLVVPGAWYIPPGSAEKGFPGNGVKGLDTYYPFYPGPHTTQYPVGVPANGFQLTTYPFDGPAITGLSTSNPININYRVNETYQNYVMYNPPGSDTCWVPLQCITWYWTANDTVPAGGWATWNNSNDAGTIAVSGITDQTSSPVWSALTHG